VSRLSCAGRGFLDISVAGVRINCGSSPCIIQTRAYWHLNLKRSTSWYLKRRIDVWVVISDRLAVFPGTTPLASLSSAMLKALASIAEVVPGVQDDTEPSIP
jgi:hypothetical protein